MVDRDISKGMVQFVLVVCLLVCLNKIFFLYLFPNISLCFILNIDCTHKVGLNKIISYLESPL